MKLQHSFEVSVQALISKQEMLAISDKIQREYALVKSLESQELAAKTRLSKQELLEVSDNISRYYAPRILSNSKKLVLLAIDPQHLYAYWNLGDNKDNALSQEILKGNVVLRIYSQTDEIQDTDTLQQVEITINELQSGQKIRLPSYEKSADYSASIGKVNSKKPFVSLLNANLSNAYHKKSRLKITKINQQDSTVFNGSDYSKIQNSENDMLQGHSSDKLDYASTNNSGKGKKK